MARLRSYRTQVGRRGAFLLFLALLDVLYGYSLIATPPSAVHLDLILSLAAWGWVWLSAGCLLAAGAFVRRDRIFFAIASMLKTAWAGAWAVVWIKDPIPRAWVSVAIWAAFAAIVLVVSTWPEVFPLKPGSHND